MTLARLALLSFATIVFAFLLLPLVVVVLASLNEGEYLSFPPAGLSLRWYAAFLGSATYIAALRLSVYVALISSLVAVILGTMAAIFYVRYQGASKEVYRLAMVAPLVLPEILTAIALLFFFNHLFGGTRTLLPLIVGHVVITLPFVFLTVSSALYNMPAGVEEAARTLGASPWRTFTRVTLPLVKSGVVAGGMLAFIISFDNVTISLLLKAVGTSTLPIQLFDDLRLDFDPTAAAASAISVALTLAVVILVDAVYGIRAVRF